MERRVVVTGLGVVSSLGLNIQDFFDNLLKGKSGVSRITRFDVSNLEVQFAAEIKNFPFTDRFDVKLAKRTDRFTQYALWASLSAVEDAQLDLNKLDKTKAGVIIGSGMGGIETWEIEHIKFLQGGPKKVSPLLVPMMIPDMASGQVSIYFGFKGPNFCVTSACASGAHAIGEAFRLIKSGDADLIITGGSEAPITGYCISSFANMGALSKRNEEPEKASRPFDRDRNGFVLGEGCGVVILEELGSALKRNAKIYCEICGYGASADAYHITAPDENGEGAYMAMANALKEAKLSPTDIDYINAHGTSTKLNDKVEVMAIKRLFGEHAYKLLVNSTKSMIGHLLGGAGAIEFVVTCLSVYYNKVHPTINLDNPDEGMDLDFVRFQMREKEIFAALNNSFGFGGHNACLAVKKFVGG
ncbi:MAG: beta-ketoacyl-ACP synthase II [candidate division WOR-3 bacterium]|nr:beta-ketoacyl-ACP synthase II [candidate division WOR-3 bacterium]MCX7837674.1 beta-ketoacyl-ACP synthase II [candidate division WOR-3 bacterium]MDW8114690.1 beta-ketoacyl-ACP synthase II [candidate division WOR-3 bacterium]